MGGAPPVGPVGIGGATLGALNYHDQQVIALIALIVLVWIALIAPIAPIALNYHEQQLHRGRSPRCLAPTTTRAPPPHRCATP
eukprot:3326912-Prymnesium_polylepis.1